MFVWYIMPYPYCENYSVHFTWVSLAFSCIEYGLCLLKAINDPGKVAITNPNPDPLHCHHQSRQRGMFVSCRLCPVCGPLRVRLNTTGERCAAKMCEACQRLCYVSPFPEGQNGHDKAISTLSASPWQRQLAYLSPRLMGLQHGNKGGGLRQTCGRWT